MLFSKNTGPTHPENFSTEIQVFGLNVFPENRWRNAILHFLFGMWSETEAAMTRPKISFKGFTLRFDSELNRFVAYKNAGHVEDTTLETFLGETGNAELMETEHVLELQAPSWQEAEIALMRFVKCSRIRVLAIGVQNEGEVFFAKHPDTRSTLFLGSRNLPTFLEYAGVPTSAQTLEE